MKIGLVLPALPTYSETFFRNKVLGLQQNGLEVVLFVGGNPPENEFLGCKVVKAPQLGGNSLHVVFMALGYFFMAILINPRQSYKLYRLNQKDGLLFKKNLKQTISNQFLLGHRLDWLHFGFGTMAIGRENIAQAIGAKMAVSFRGFDLYLSPLKHPGCYDVLFKRHVKYHVLSNGMKQSLITYGIPETFIHVISPAIDTTFFQSTERPSDSSVLQLVTIARLHWKKGLDYTLQALAIFKAHKVSFHYTIIGEGDQLERLKFTAYQLGITEQVSFIGKLPQKDVKTYLEQGDIYLQYSIQEGFCNAVLEAQAMGLLCIVSNAEGLDENVLDNQTGWVVPKREPTLLAEKILEVAQLSSAQKDVVRDTAVNRVKKDFALEQQQLAFVEFYKVF